jgi:hypothetical protein
MRFFSDILCENTYEIWDSSIISSKEVMVSSSDERKVIYFKFI